jgi:hypothetical protein
MATYVSVLNPSTNNVEGHQKWLGGLYSAGVATHLGATQLQVVQRGAGANFSVDVSIGQAIFALPSGLVSYWGWTDAATNVPFTTAADATNPRIDAVVAWIDPTVASSGTTNSLGALKFIIVVGTASGTPVAPTDSAIQTAVGSSNAWLRLANVTLAAGTTTITNAIITDSRSQLSPLGVSKTGAIGDGSVTPVKWTNPYKFSVYSAASQTISTARTTFTWDTEKYDTNNNFASNSYTAPVAGYYRFSTFMQLSSGSNTTGLYIRIRINTVDYKEFPNPNTGFNGGGQATTTVKLAAGDVVDITTGISAGSYTSVGGELYNNFCGEIVSQT